MSKVKIQGNASGIGIFTVAAPATNTDRTIILPDVNATILTTADLNPSTVVTTSNTNTVTRTMLNNSLGLEGVCFSAYHNTTQNLSSSTTTKINYDGVLHDPNNNYNGSTSTYTTPITGWYWLSANIRGSVGSNHRFDISFYVNGAVTRGGGQNQTGSNDASTLVVTVLYLTAGNQVTVYANQNGGSSMATSNASNVDGGGSTGIGRFEGFLLRAA